MIANVELVKRINNSGWKIYLAITGGGQTFIGDYLSISGGSKVIMGATVPYSQPVFDRFVKVRVDNYASEEAARKLALAAFAEARACGVPLNEAMGVGAASSLAKDDEREGREHRMNVAIHHSTATEVYTLTLKQGRSRQQEEELLSYVILHAVAHGTRCSLRMPHIDAMLGETESFDTRTSGLIKHIDLVLGKSNVLWNNKFEVPSSQVAAFYPGSWNPVHEGHKRVWMLSQEILKTIPFLEMSVINADKGALDYVDIETRTTFMRDLPYVLTREATFVGKSELFSSMFDETEQDVVFIVGADTWNRIWEPQYAGAPALVEAMFNSSRVKFLVFGRKGVAIRTDYGQHLRIMDDRATNFDFDMSSTNIRKAK